MLSEDSRTSDVCQIHQRVSSIPWWKFIHDSNLEISFRLKPVSRSQTEQNCWDCNADNCKGWCQKNLENQRFLPSGNKRSLRISPKTALSIDECNPLRNVNVLSSNLVKLYRAIPPLITVQFQLEKLRFRSDTFHKFFCIKEFKSSLWICRFVH